MHELSLAQGLLVQLQELAAAHGVEKILHVRVNIGRASGVVVDSFVFGFDAIKMDVPLTMEAVLHIEEVEGSDLVLMQVEME
ncbi:MAG TPA: hydrogenase maturation nickel metallochaperone HypA [Desulfobulbus sp.]|nr:hydrogenase maturation nickel metallochaperone HypA [Desulfobulbus sp.]